MDKPDLHAFSQFLRQHFEQGDEASAFAFHNEVCEIGGEEPEEPTGRGDEALDDRVVGVVIEDEAHGKLQNTS